MATDTKTTSETASPTKVSGRLLPADLWLRLASHGLAIGLVLAAVWLARVDFSRVPSISLPAVLALTGTPQAAVVAAPAATATPEPLALPTAADETNGATDLTRLADVHTIIPSRPRYEIQQYTVQLHDTLFIIASKYNIKPDTVLWGNPALAGNPNTLSVGQELNILPVDGALRIVQSGDTLAKIAKVFHSTVEDIVNFPGNDLDPSDPQLKDGETIIIPGGWRDVTIWQLPVVSRHSTGGGSSGEPGACRGPFSGPTGTFTFAWPANNHYLSGNDYSPTIHPGIDIAAGTGAPIYASDTGVVVFAGLSLYGYGNLVIIDHGNGWQTAYGHLSQIIVVCGGAIYQGQVLGLAGSTGNSTGPHLHFEMRSDTYGRVNPWLYLGK